MWRDSGVPRPAAASARPMEMARQNRHLLAAKAAAQKHYSMRFDPNLAEPQPEEDDAPTIVVRGRLEVQLLALTTNHEVVAVLAVAGVAAACVAAGAKSPGRLDPVRAAGAAV